jgi:hypothetical protein
MGFSLKDEHLTLSTINRTLIIAINVTFRYDSSVGVATDYRLEDRGSIPCRDLRFPLPHSVQRGSGANTASYPKVTGASSHGVKATGARC